MSQGDVVTHSNRPHLVPKLEEQLGDQSPAATVGSIVATFASHSKPDRRIETMDAETKKEGKEGGSAKEKSQ